MWDFLYQFSKQNKSDLKFDDEFLSDTSYVRTYNLKTKAKFQNPTHGFGEQQTIVDGVCQISRLYDLFSAQSIRLKMAKLLKNKNGEIKQ